MLSCHGCSQPIPPSRRTRAEKKWCSEACRTRTYYRRNPDKKPKHHPRCAVKYATCYVCQELAVSRGSRVPTEAWVCYKPACRRRRRADRQLVYAAAKREQGIDIYASRREANHARYQEERKAGLRPSKRAANPESYRAGDQLRRARKAGVEAEVVQPATVFERDGWLCGICFMPVNSELSWPDPGSASLDHIVPLSKGGPHTYTNCRCAHLDCNVRRGAD